MPLQTARLLEMLQIGESIAGIFDLPAKSLPEPGQYLPTQALNGRGEALTHPLFSVAGPASHNALGPIPSRWQPGDRITCLPPHGNGFHLPTNARRVGLLALDDQPIRILPLIGRALAQNAAIAFFFQEQPHPAILDWIPASVEINALNELSKNMDWPDFLAVETNRENLPELTPLFGSESTLLVGEVLVRTTMPCCGIGECGVCAVKTKGGWRHACSDGPVFPLKELLNVA
ncbi:MAG: hypothetical protein ACOCYU_00380 [Brevefilum sp.]